MCLGCRGGAVGEEPAWCNWKGGVGGWGGVRVRVRVRKNEKRRGCGVLGFVVAAVAERDGEIERVHIHIEARLDHLVRA